MNHLIYGLGSFALCSAIIAPAFADVAPLASLPKVVIRAIPSVREVAIVVKNSGPIKARVKRRLVLERKTREGWEAVPGMGEIWIRDSCKPPKRAVFSWAGGGDECVSLEPHSQVNVPPWLGTFGDAQCGCERCVRATPGVYRFRARTCDGTDVLGDRSPWRLQPPNRRPNERGKDGGGASPLRGFWP